MSYYMGKRVTVGDGYMTSESGHTCFRWHCCGEAGKRSIDVMGGGWQFSFHADAVVDDFGSLVRVG